MHRALTSTSPFALLFLATISCGGGSSPPTIATSVPVVTAKPVEAPPVAKPISCRAGIANVLRTLREPVRVEFYHFRGLPAVDAFVRDVRKVLAEYETLSEGKLRVEMVEPRTKEDREWAEQNGMQEAAFGEAQGESNALVTRGFLGVVFKYRTEKEAIPVLSPDGRQGVEYWIGAKLHEMQDRADSRDRVVGVISKKKELALSDDNLVPVLPGKSGPSITSIMTQALPFLKTKEVDLRGGEQEIDGSLSGLIVTQPGEPYTDKELRRIDQFLMRGNKSLTVFASAVNLGASDTEMKATLNTWGLEKLLAGYGIEMRKDAVLDWDSSLRIPVTLQSGQMSAVLLPALVQVQNDEAPGGEQRIDTSFPGLFRMEEVSWPFPSTLVPHPDKQPTATMTVIARTTPRATVDTSESIDMKVATTWTPQGTFGERVVGISLDGTIRSAFAGQPNLGVNAPSESSAHSRIAVISSSQFLTNPFARASNSPEPRQLKGDADTLPLLAQEYAKKRLTGVILVLKNTLDWMTFDEDLRSCARATLGQ